MEKLFFQRQAEVYQTLASPIRLELLSFIRGGEKRVNELAELTELNQAKVSQHLRVMRGKGLVATRREGVNIYYRIAHSKIIRACDLICDVLVEQAAEHAELLGALAVPRGRVLKHRVLGKTKL